MQFEESQTQSLIDSKIMEFEMKSRQGLQVGYVQWCVQGCCSPVGTAAGQISPAHCTCTDGKYLYLDQQMALMTSIYPVSALVYLTAVNHTRVHDNNSW